MLDFIVKLINMFLAYEPKKKGETTNPNVEPALSPVTEKPKPAEIKKTYRTFVTEKDIITSSGRYPARATSPELTDEVRSNIKETAKRVNDLLNDIGWAENVIISSGFRTSASNAATKGAAKRSSHMMGMAVDIMQPKNDNKLGKLIRSTQANKGKDGILAKHGLMMEAIEATVGENSSWTHIDWVSRPFRASYEFKP